jgi:hypothetical protein
MAASLSAMAGPVATKIGASIVVDTQLAIWRNELMNNAHEQTALTDDEREVIIATAQDAATCDYLPESNYLRTKEVIRACAHDVRHDPQKYREAQAIALVWGRAPQ